jgi:hypothetical protein
VVNDELGGTAALADLERHRVGWVDHVSRPIQLPEPGLALDLASRRSSEVRMLKHLHQMCLMHRENFALSNQVKHLYLVDAFRTLVDNENPLALFSVARSMFELSAFLHEVQTRLQETALALTSNNWVQMGEKFFGLIVRARFATTHPNYRDLLIEQGVSAARLKPFNITQCVSGLASEPEHRDAESRYAALCDSVHHNLGSGINANSGSAVVDAARSSGGGMLLTNGPTPITQYEYPVVGKTERAVDELAGGFLRDAQSCTRWLNLTPATPFSAEHLRAVTGSQLGVVTLREPRTRG